MPLNINGKIDRALLPHPSTCTTDIVHQFGDTSVQMPQDTLELLLANIMKQVLNIPVVGVKTSFFDLGGNSFTAVKFTAEVEKHLNLEIPLSVLFQEPTLEAMAQALRSSSTHTAIPVIPLQKQGTQRPIFFVHPAGGIALFFIHLAKYFTDRPFYAIEDPSFYGEQYKVDSIETLAKSYLEALKLVQPHGPYILFGFCFGGVVAYEMTKQLKHIGDDVAILGMLDARVSVESWDDAHTLRHFILQLGRITGLKEVGTKVTEENLLTFSDKELFDFCAELVSEANLAPLGKEADYLQRLLNYFKSHVVLQKKYNVTEKLDVPIVFIHSREKTLLIPNALSDWQAHFEKKNPSV